MSDEINNPVAAGTIPPPTPSMSIDQWSDNFDASTAERQLLRRLAASEQWQASEVPAKIRDTIAALRGGGGGGRAAASAPAPVPPPAPIAPSNTGAPAATPSQIQLHPDPRQWPSDVVASMTAESWHKALAEYHERTGRGNPMAGMRAQLDRRIGRRGER